MCQCLYKIKINYLIFKKKKSYFLWFLNYKYYQIDTYINTINHNTYTYITIYFFNFYNMINAIIYKDWFYLLIYCNTFLLYSIFFPGGGEDWMSFLRGKILKWYKFRYMFVLTVSKIWFLNFYLYKN